MPQKLHLFQPGLFSPPLPFPGLAALLLTKCHISLLAFGRGFGRQRFLVSPQCHPSCPLPETVSPSGASISGPPRLIRRCSRGDPSILFMTVASLPNFLLGFVPVSLLSRLSVLNAPCPQSFPSDNFCSLLTSRPRVGPLFLDSPEFTPELEFLIPVSASPPPHPFPLVSTEAGTT